MTKMTILQVILLFLALGGLSFAGASSALGRVLGLRRRPFRLLRRRRAAVPADTGRMSHMPWPPAGSRATAPHRLPQARAAATDRRAA